MSRRMIPSLAIAATFTFVAQSAFADGDAAAAQQANIPKDAAQLVAGPTLKEGTFRVRPGGLPIIICTKPVPLKPGMPIKLTPAQQRHQRSVKSIKAQLQDILSRVPVGKGLRKDLGHAIEALGKLKNPCDPIMTLMMGTSARCQGSSTDP